MRPTRSLPIAALAAACGLALASPLAMAQFQRDNKPTQPSEPGQDGNQDGNQAAEQGEQPGAEQQADPARAALLAAQQAVKNADTISYEVTSSISMMMGGAMEITATVHMKRKEDSRDWLVRREGGADLPQMGRTEFLILNDGSYVTYVDHDSKRVREEIIRSTRKHRTLTLADSAWLETLTAATPYADALSKGTSFELRENAERIDGTMCDEVKISLGDDRGSQTWWFGVEDHLPRKHVQAFTSEMGRTYELKNVRAGHELSDELFEIETPEGYEFITTRRTQETVETGVDGNMTRTTMPTRPRTMAPDFTLTSAAGKEVQLSDLRDRVVLLNFWASWSGASKSALDDVQAIHEKYAEAPVTVLSLSWRERKPEAAAEEVKSRGHSYTLLPGADAVASEFQVKGFPTFIVVGKDGAILETIAEYTPDATRQALIKKIDEALAGTAAAQETTVQPVTTPGGNGAGGNGNGNGAGGNGNGAGGNGNGNGNGNG